MTIKKQAVSSKPQAASNKIISLLKEHYPDAHCALNFKNPFELLVATILSAQCTDVRVNIVTKDLFAKFPTAEKMAKARLPELEKLIRSAGFYKNKAKNLLACAQTLVDEHKGQVPKDMEALVRLPGVGRKTANVVLGNAFGITSGVVVDTHVGRLALRFGWTKNEDPKKVELDLQEIVDKTDWILISHLMISHGREICKARSPNCKNCFLADLCPSKM